MSSFFTVFLLGIGLITSAIPRSAMAADPVICSANVTSGSLNFGVINPLSPANIDINSNLAISCKNMVKTNFYVSVCFNIGDGNGPITNGNRVVSNGTSLLQYQIFSDAARSSIWGSALSGSFPTPQILNFYLRKRATYSANIPMYGRLYGSQTTAIVGNYADNYVFPNISIAGTLFTGSQGVGNCTQTGTDAGGFSTFTVNAIVQSNCNVTATNLDFGIQPLLTTNVTATSLIQVQCTNGSGYQVGLNNGVNAIGTQRYMQSSVGTISYGMFQNASDTISWNNSTNQQSGVGTGNIFNHTVYGLVTPQPLTKAGIYQDTVQVVITY